MNYSEFLKRIASAAGSAKLGFRQTGLCLRPRHLPATLVSVEGECEIIKVPDRSLTRFGNTVPVTKIARFAFSGNRIVTDLFLPHTVETIADCAFAGCVNLRNITIPKSVTAIGEGTFAGCEKLQNIYYEGTKEEWDDIRITRRRRTVEFGDPIPGTPVLTVADDRITPVPGNEALFFCAVHLECSLKNEEKSEKTN